jgi:hypothetical protein
MIDSVASPPPFDDVSRLRAGPAASWSAIFCGAAVAISTSLLLLALGAGLGFASISPWSDKGVSASTFTIAGVIWVIVTQWISALLGGYITGRLRHRWLATHTHEVFFRDTAHGLVTWAVATLAVAAVATGALTSFGGSSMHARAMGHDGMRTAANGPLGSGPMMHGEQGDMKGASYELDKLFRAPAATAGPAHGDARGEGRGEAAHIILHAAATGAMPDEDRYYLATLVAANTGATAQEARARVDAFVAEGSAARDRAKAAADAARKAAAQTAIYTALAMLIGAFIASVSAAIGGRLRDEHL